MTAAAMAQLIVDNIKTLNSDVSGAIEAEMLAYWTLICQGIIDHIQQAAVVNGTVTGGGSSSGATTQGTIT